MPDSDTAADLDALTPEIARDIDKVLQAHSTSRPGAQSALGSGAVGSMLAGPLTDQLGASTALVLVAIGTLAASSIVTWRMRERGARSARHGSAATRWAMVPTPTASGPRHARRDPAGQTPAARWSVKRPRQPVDDGVRSTVS